MYANFLWNQFPPNAKYIFSTFKYNFIFLNYFLLYLKTQSKLVVLWYTRIWELDSISFGELQGCHPFLSLHFRCGFQIKCMRPTVGNNYCVGIFGMNVSIGEVNCASTCVSHLGLISEIKLKIVNILNVTVIYGHLQ